MTAKELHERQSWSLAQKIDHSLGVIDQFVQRTDGKVYVAFSGGKDSTVLMHLCEVLKKDILCVFANTGCESPSIVQFVNKCKGEGHNIITVRPKMTPREVWAKYGFPLVSKEVADQVHCVRVNPDSVHSRKAMDLSKPFHLSKKWRYLVDAPYDISKRCCDILKKEPSRRIAKEMGLNPIIGTMASESILREKSYLRQGQCNSFAEGHTQSMPLSIWTDDDIWAFIRERGIEIADIYEKGADRTGCVACGFGCQFKKDNRLRLLYDNYPKYYRMIMSFENNGVTYREALRKMLEVEGLRLPDEDLTLFDVLDLPDDMELNSAFGG